MAKGKRELIVEIGGVQLHLAEFKKLLENKLKEDGHNIIIITARWSSEYLDADELTQKWLQKYDPTEDRCSL